jgi:hypothetical protein
MDSTQVSSPVRDLTRRSRFAFPVACVVVAGTFFGLAVTSSGAATSLSQQCMSTADQVAVKTNVDNSVQDNPDFKASDTGTASDVLWPDLTTSAMLDKFEQVAVLRVVGRDLPMRQSGSLGVGGRRPGALDPISDRAAPGTPVDPGQALVVRPTRFQVERLIKGDVGSCMVLNVPGGTVGSYHYTTSLFPSRLHLGDRVLMLGHGSENDAEAELMLYVDAFSGLTKLPFGGADAIDVDTWTP